MNPTPTETTRSLDHCVRAARADLAARGVPAPQVLFLMATGVGGMPDHLRSAVEVPLGEVDGVPAPWDEVTLVAGRLGHIVVWMLDDASGEPMQDEPAAAWARAFPVWLAANAGASVCVHTSAGSALHAEQAGADGDDPAIPSVYPPERAPAIPIGGFAFVHDHLNLSGTTPLLGLGTSELGPLFPDQTLLHHIGLRHAARARAEALGRASVEAIAACTRGPALETPAERRMLERAGADVAVPSLAYPLIASAHAGIAMLAIVVITDGGEGPTDVASILETAGETQPALEELLLALSEDLRATVAVLEDGVRS